jgi:pSer/pThr/pTyr-binding forkhead associated (FHA) protein
VIGQEHDFTRPDDSALAISLGKGRVTTSFHASKLSLSFIGGLCAGRTGLLFGESPLLIGREDQCQIVLDGETVSRIHCEIIRRGAIYVLKDGSRNGTFINGERVPDGQSIQLRDGDQIRIGQNVMLVHLSYGSATHNFTGKLTTAQRVSHAIQLKPHTVVKGMEEGVTQSYSEERITIGRRAENQVVLEADNISRNHTSIERRDGMYFAHDLDSANGTFLNEQRIDIAQLRDGDRLRIGNFTIVVGLVDQDCVLNFKKPTK